MSEQYDIDMFTEIFPVQLGVLPRLSAYKLDIRGGDFSTVGGKLSYRLRKRFPGHWVWTNGQLLTDTYQDKAEIMRVVEELWHEQPSIFRGLVDVLENVTAKPSPQMQSDFVTRGMFADIDEQIRQLLVSKTQDLGNARVERVYEVRGWVVGGKPTVSISVSSHIIHKQDLKAYFATHLQKPQDLIGLFVRDKTSTLKGEITEIAGEMKAERVRLLALTQREEMQEIIDMAPDDELVVSVRAERDTYDYPISALQIIVRTMDYNRFGINSQQALKLLRIEPGTRSRFVREIADIAKRYKLIGDAYNSRDFPPLFVAGKDVGFTPRLCFGGNHIEEYQERNIRRSLLDYGLYRRADKFRDNNAIKIGMINALDSTDPKIFWSQIENELQHLHFSMDVVGNEHIKSLQRGNLEQAVESLEESKPDILIALLPDEYDEDDEEWGAYHHFKSLTVGRGIASQVVYESTISRQYAIANIVLGVLGKTGNIPFVLAEPLPYADLVVGIDIARERKKRLPGSINATAITRIYFSNGEFLRYVIHDTPLEGETVPTNVLQSLFPASEFRGKRVVIHRDSYFRGNEKGALLEWAKNIGAEFYPVEVIKAGAPRLYAARQGQFLQPPKGSIFKLSAIEGLLVSSLPPFTNATPKPLRIRTEAPLTIEQAIHSVLSMTLLHYGSLRPPRLPVSIHYSDRIAYLALKGIKPKDLEGNIPFWL